jgi:hypothetical protein
VKRSTAYAPLILAVFLALPACPGPDAKQKALQTSLTALNAARDGFVVWDKHHQEKIVENATSLEQGKAALAAYRAKRAPVEQGFVIAYSALAVAALEKSAEMILEAVLAAKEVYKLIKILTDDEVKTPPVEESTPAPDPAPAPEEPAAPPAEPAPASP